MSTERAPYGRHTPLGGNGHPRGNGHRGPNGHGAQYQGPTYYGKPAVKPSYYQWLVVAYLFIGGLAGAAQVIAAVADHFGGRRDRGTVRAGRYLALAGALASPALLISDIHTPQRWYNMLRIFRSTSPMSIGSWTLALFGTFSGLTAVGQLVEDVGLTGLGQKLARLFSVPAALAGGVIAFYTGSLLAATSVPLWASVSRLLPGLFGSSAVSTATAALSLLANGENDDRADRLSRLALVANGAELVALRATQQRWQREGLGGPLAREPMSSIFQLGVLGLGTGMPLVVHAVQVITGGRFRAGSALAALGTLLGGLALRAVVVFAGNESARSPEEYFRLTRGHNGAGDGARLQATGGEVRRSV